ncbi:MAG: hypothetical protein VX951_14390, partial [Planctomycetota bacterium]|nr:hypothetical protein [Planctomycetota bacterium]
SDAVRSIQRLGDRGFDSYLVGGCVRDLLLDRDPKDFDIATEARPQQVKRAFPRNCRIIGRRFKLAHLHFNGNQKILEVATFRSSPLPPSADNDESGEFDSAADDDGRPADPAAEDDAKRQDDSYADPELPDQDSTEDADDDSDADLLIIRDNEFGTIEEDALRRDFTINALFLNPLKNEIIDYVDGISDVEAHIIRTIGDPVTRFREDPIRILRAIKFAGRLSFTFDPATGDAMRETAPDLVRAAPPRILEEILRLLRGGHALPSFQLLRDIGGIAPLLPTVHEYLQSSDPKERRIFWCLLETLDNHINNGAVPSNAVLLGCLFLRPVLTRYASSDGGSPATVAEELVGPLAQDLRLPRRDTGALKRVCSVHPRFTASGKRRFRLASFLQDPYLPEALELFELSCYATGEDFEHLERWRELRSEASDDASHDEAPVDVAKEPDKSRRSKTPAKRSRGKPANERSKRTVVKKPAKKKAKTQKKPSKRGRKKDEVLTLEPEAIDVSAFDRELGHREIPRFDTIVEDAGGVSKPKRRVKIRDDDAYKPPPPPGTGDAAPPSPPPKDDTYGDW